MKNINVKGYALPFEDMDKWEHGEKEVSKAVLARGRAALELFSMGES